VKVYTAWKDLPPGRGIRSYGSVYPTRVLAEADVTAGIADRVEEDEVLDGSYDLAQLQRGWAEMGIAWPSK
jgi:hypothetical protein